MPAPAFLGKLPQPVVYGLYGTVAGLLAALTAGELIWYLLRPPPAPGAEAHTAPPVAQLSPKVAVTVSPKVQVYPGGMNFVTVRVARERPDSSPRSRERLSEPFAASLPTGPRTTGAPS